ncbi:MAG: toll/interleukin-1 receptor domain-containing protein [Polyangiaceae bacterium]|nr:toll/interleukin-1 receptor domain-containing protein [Polyangiaceae bacterium]
MSKSKSKPTVFFSHSPRDKDRLTRLKQMFVAKTGGTIDVFLSSDGQSIPLGRNWVHKVQEALERATLMIVFLSPASLDSRWVYFEAGFVYAKGVRVIPVGIFGVDLTQLPPPISLLQGFNITSPDGLDNLIAVSNEEFGHQHAQVFSLDEYNEFFRTESGARTGALARHSAFIDDIRVTLTRESGATEPPSRIIEITAEALQKLGVEHQYLQGGMQQQSGDVQWNFIGRPQHDVGESSIYFYGARMYVEESKLEFRADPRLADMSLAVLESILRTVRKGGVGGCAFRFLPGKTLYTSTPHKLHAHFHGSEARMVGTWSYEFRSLTIRIDNQATTSQSERGRIALIPKEDRLILTDMADALALLIEREVIREEDW